MEKPLESLRGRDILRITDFSRQELRSILDLAHALKRKQKAREAHRLLEGRALAMILEKPSSRTRISFEVGMFQLGGHAVMINPAEIRMGERESVADVARTISRYVDGVMIRSNYHWTIEEFSQHATVPVINGLSDHHHPCQALADILTIEERKSNLTDLKVCYVGDGNNVCNSLLEICGVLGISFVAACPTGYEPLLRRKSKAISFTSDPREAADGADVIYTDVWISMGQESITGRKLQEFLGFAVTPELMSCAKPDAIFMHCLPAHRGLEVDESVLEGEDSVVFDQAENRLHAQKALLASLL